MSPNNAGRHSCPHSHAAARARHGGHIQFPFGRSHLTIAWRGKGCLDDGWQYSQRVGLAETVIKVLFQFNVCFDKLCFARYFALIYKILHALCTETKQFEFITCQICFVCGIWNIISVCCTNEYISCNSY